MSQMKGIAAIMSYHLKGNLKRRLLPTSSSNPTSSRNLSIKNIVTKTANYVGFKITNTYHAQSLKESMFRCKDAVGNDLNDATTVIKLWGYRNMGVELKRVATYGDLMATNRFKRSGYKTAALMLAAPVVPHVCYYLLLVPLLSPRNMISQNLWTEKQNNLYSLQNQYQRELHFPRVLEYMDQQTLSPASKPIVDKLVLSLKANIVPQNADLEGFKSICDSYPFCLDETNDFKFLRSLCKFYSVFAIVPMPKLSRNLNKMAADILDMDSMLREMDVDRLSPKDVSNAVHIRGLDDLSHAANVYWLKNWLCLSENCCKRDSSFLIFAMIFQSMNYDESSYKLKVFGYYQ